MDDLTQYEEEYTYEAPYWRCEECLYKNYTKVMPKDRVAFYTKVDKGIVPRCPKCKSESFMPFGW